MNDLTDPKKVKDLQSILRTRPMSDKDVMIFLEKLCGWYEFSATETNDVLINNGKRQVLATLKTLLEFNPEQVAQIAKENDNG